MKATKASAHLSDEQFADLLAGIPALPAVDEHLQACEFCRTELASVSESLGSFRDLGTEWAHAAAPARISVPSSWTLRRSQLPSWGSGLTAMATAGLLAFGLGFTPAALHTTSAPHAPAVAPSNAELAADNRLMQSIDQELGYRTQAKPASMEAHPSGQLQKQHAVETVAN